MALSTQPVHELRTHIGPINAVTFSSLGGTYVLSGSSDRQIHLSRTEQQGQSTSSPSLTPATSNSITSKPPGVSAAAAPLVTTRPIQKYTSHGYAVLSIAVSPDNKTFASSGGDRAVFIWDIQTPDTTLRRLGTNTTEGHTSRINCVTYAGADQSSVLISGGDDTSVRLWDLRSRDARPLMVWSRTDVGARDAVTAVDVADDGTSVYTASVDGRLRRYDLRQGRVVADTFPAPVTSLALSRVDGGKTALVGCLDGKLRLMDLERGECLRTFPATEDPRFADDGAAEGNGESPTPAASYANTSLRLRSCLGGSYLDNAAESLVLSGSEADGHVRAWDVMSGKLVANFAVDQDESSLMSTRQHVGAKRVNIVSVVRWRPGNRLQDRRDVWAAAGVDGVVRIFDGGGGG